MDYIESKCLVCPSDKATKIKEVGDKSIVKCGSCELEYSNPMPDDSEFDEFYSTYNNPRAGERIVRKNARKNFGILEEKYGLSRESKLMDFGCGGNFFVQEMESSEWIGYDKYTSPKEPSGKFDFITLWGVLEHLADPVDVLEGLVGKLNSGGKIVMTTVGTETPIPYQYKVPEHVTWWSSKSVEELLDRTGFSTKEISPYFMFQDPNVYLGCVLRAGKVPNDIKEKISINSKEDVFVPTNEIFIVGEKRTYSVEK